MISHPSLFYQYVRLAEDTNVELVMKLILKVWKLEVPNLVISVTGGAKSFHLKPRLKEVFQRGLIKAAKSTGAWIITGKRNEQKIQQKPPILQ
jgi:transient receptor potential cation channel subfamily M protein 2